MRPDWDVTEIAGISSTEATLSTTMNATDVDVQFELLKKNVDDVFLLINGIFVSLMQTGFACLEAGCIRSKNATNIVLKNVLDLFISAFFYWLFGYAFAYGEGNGFLGYTNWVGDVPRAKMAYWFFQMVFAATAATIISGSVAERCNFIAYLIYSGYISGFMYPVVSHWVWSDHGWLKELGYKDFAGAGAVHVLSGVSALVAATFLGPRIGRFGKPGQEEIPMTGHSTPLIGTGAMILIAGFLAFNGGSLGSMSGPHESEIVAITISNTVLGGSGGSIITLAAYKSGLFGVRKWSFSETINGGLAGMVSVCAEANDLTLWQAVVSGVGAGIVYMLFSRLVVLCKVDDPLDAVAVHLGGGLWGLISASIFNDTGLIYGVHHENSMVLAYRVLGAAAIMGWSIANCCVLFGLMKLTGILRVSPENEIKGMDETSHHEPAYPPEAWGLKLPIQVLPQSQTLDMHTRSIMPSIINGPFKATSSHYQH